jgi:uncharacterized phage protein (TIGR02218 family)
VIPQKPEYPEYGAALLDQPVEYQGLTYHPIIGAQPSALIYSSDLSVDGGDAYNLFPEFDIPELREADILAGAYDQATCYFYLVNYADLSQGHVLLAKGTTGRFFVTDKGLSYTHELRSLSQALKQSITEKWSIGCRATFGSQSVESSAGDLVERFPCNYPAETLWEPGTVTGVGLESNQSFDSTPLSPPFGGNPGKVRWLTGRNAGRENEVDEFGSSGIGLTFPTMFPIQIGDTFEFRDDCPKTPEACKVRDNWPNYRGEPNIPVGDAGQIAVPGASAGIGTGGRLTVSDNTDPV